MPFVTALPLIGYAFFFLDALIRQNFHWHPAGDEAVVVPLIWLGAILIPVCGWRLWRASRFLGESDSPGAGAPPAHPAGLRRGTS